jgi:hypothetical protein
VRYNRKRLKGSKGPEDCLMAITSLYDVLLSVCKVGAHVERVGVGTHPSVPYTGLFDGNLVCTWHD